MSASRPFVSRFFFQLCAAAEASQGNAPRQIARCLGHDRRCAFERGAVHQPDIARLVERGRAMLGAAIVPQHRVALAPMVAIDKARLPRELLQEGDELPALAFRQPFDVAGPAADLERDPADLRMTTTERMSGIRAV